MLVGQIYLVTVVSLIVSNLGTRAAARARAAGSAARGLRGAACWARSTASTTRLGLLTPANVKSRVVGAGGVEVDGAHAQQALEHALLGVHVLDAVDARLLDLLERMPRLMRSRWLVIV